MPNKKTGKFIKFLSLLMSILMVVTSLPVMSIVGLAEELSGEQIATAPRYELNFNKGWKFNYGDVANAQSTVYSGFSSRYVTVSAKNNPNATYSGGAGASWPEAEFTFAGTGFDLISVTSKDTGAMNLTVAGEDGNIIRNHTVNTYYGYTYGQIFRSADGRQRDTY